jgi:four helix bundle protein
VGILEGKAIEDRALVPSTRITSYRDLLVWQQSMDLAVTCYQLTKTFPREELYGLSSQIRRASSSIPANIAEGYGREYRKEYIHFLRISQGSLKELETHLILSSRVNIIIDPDLQIILTKTESIGKLLNGLIRALESKERK